MEFIAKIFKNSKTDQRTLVIPKGLDKLKVEKLPPFVKVRISVPKDYLSKVNEVMPKLK